MYKNCLYSILVFVLAVQYASAQTEMPNLEFIENKGQWDSHVLLKADIGNGSLFFHRKGIKVVLHNEQEMADMVSSHAGVYRTDSSKLPDLPRNFSGRPAALRTHAYSVNFLNMNEATEIIPDKPLDSYNNYFIGNDSTKWGRNCRIYQGVTYKNIYPGIDLRYYTDNGKLKYDLIIHPGGNPENIALQYEGLDGLTVTNNRLLLKTSVGDVREMEPYSYQSGENGREEVRVKYRVSKDRVVRFDVSQFNNTRVLVIDPTLVFATFTGSKASNWGFTATPGPDGTFFAGGIVFGDGFPVSTGAIEPNFRGGTNDVGIMKFSSNGRTRLYATYIGGNQNECPHSMYSDPQGNLVVMGRTYSDNFPFFNIFGKRGGCDMFIVKLNVNGSNIIGSACVAGTQYDAVNVEDQLNQEGGSKEVANSLIKNYGDDSRSEVILDGSNNIYVASCTRSKDDFPITAGAFQTTFGGGKQDGVLVKLSPNCTSLLFASFLGGTGEDACFVLKISPITGDIYVAGATTSTNMPGNKAGVMQAGFAGGVCDGYISVVSNDGSTLKKTTYLGTSGFDAIYGIEFDKAGFPYVMGSTTGKWITTPNVGFINPGAKQFVGKIKPDLSAYVYSTTFGSNNAPNPNISPVAFLVDRCENVYVSGWGGWLYASKDPYGMAGTAGMPVSPNALKKLTDNRDFYFIVIKKNASALLYATFYGQNDGPISISEHVDGGTSRYDRNGVIYQAICANCGDHSLTPFPTSPGVWSPRNGTGGQGCNLAAIKIAFNFAGVSADPRSIINGKYDSSGCVPLQVLFTDTVHNAKQYIWHFGDGSPDTTVAGNQVWHTYTSVGTFRVRLIAIDSNSCNVADTGYLNIRVRTDRAILDFDVTKLPPCKLLNYLFTNKSLAPPSKPFQPGDFTWDFGDGTRTTAPNPPGTSTHAYASPGTYMVRLVLNDTSYCNYPDSLTDTLRVSPLVKAQFTVGDGCAPYNAYFNNTSLGGQQFFWDFGDGSFSTEMYPTHLYADTGSYIVHMLAIDNGTCNVRDSTTQTIQVHGSPTAAFRTTPQPPEYNVPTVFHNNSTDATHYTWYFGDNDSTDKQTADTVIHQYQFTGTFNACLVAYNQFGCADTACQDVQSLINPLLDVPNAFTPGRFGENSIITVKGFGIVSMNWKIYNRYGQLVFQSNTPYLGWDGTYNGVAQPIGVYAYTLDATFDDGTKTTKSGDITLIR